MCADLAAVKIRFIEKCEHRVLQEKRPITFLVTIKEDLERVIFEVLRLILLCTRIFWTFALRPHFLMGHDIYMSKRKSTGTDGMFIPVFNSQQETPKVLSSRLIISKTAGSQSQYAWEYSFVSPILVIKQSKHLPAHTRTLLCDDTTATAALGRVPQTIPATVLRQSTVTVRFVLHIVLWKSLTSEIRHCITR